MLGLKRKLKVVSERRSKSANACSISGIDPALGQQHPQIDFLQEALAGSSLIWFERGRFLLLLLSIPIFCLSKFNLQDEIVAKFGLRSDGISDEDTKDTTELTGNGRSEKSFRWRTEGRKGWIWDACAMSMSNLTTGWVSGHVCGNRDGQITRNA